MITAEGGQDRYSTLLSNGSALIHADTTQDKGGDGKYFRPHDLLCAGYAACLNISIRMVMDYMSVKYDNVLTQVDLDRSKDDKTIFLYQVEIVGDITPETKEAVIAKALNCPVRKTLSKALDFQPLHRK